jgi:tetratricopeptide (TPR) repeat protein
LQLARAHRYRDAVAALPISAAPARSDTAPQDELLGGTAELASYWELQDALAGAGYLNGRQRNPLGAVHTLLASNRHLSATLQTVRSKLKTTPNGADDNTMAADLDRLLNGRGAAEKRIRQLEAALRVSHETGRVLEEKLKRSQAQAVPAGTGQPAPDDIVAYRHYTAGLTLYQEGRYRRAEQEFQAAVDADNQDARYQYYLGLAHWSQGAHRAAAESFRRGARLERDHKPSRVFVSAALEGLPEEAQRAVSVYRP